MSDTESTTLGDALPKEIERVQKLIPIYLSLPMGFLAAGMMTRSINRAVRAMNEGDVVAMLRAYQDLKDYEA